MRIFLAPIFLGVIVIPLFSAGCGADNYTVDTGQHERIGRHLTDGRGHTLYYHTEDIPDRATLPGPDWRVFHTGDISPAPGLAAADFGTVSSPEGKPQNTYMGWPLYLYGGDIGPGEALGDGVDNAWYAVKLPFFTVMLRHQDGYGTHLADASGRSLYVAACADELQKEEVRDARLLPFFVEDVIVPEGLFVGYRGRMLWLTGLQAGDLSAITSDSGQRQLTYLGAPLYYLEGAGPGEYGGIDGSDWTLSIQNEP